MRRSTSCRLLPSQLHRETHPQCSILVDEIEFGIAAILTQRSELEEEVFRLVHLGDGVVLDESGPLLVLVFGAMIIPLDDPIFTNPTRGSMPSSVSDLNLAQHSRSGFSCDIPCRIEVDFFRSASNEISLG